MRERTTWNREVIASRVKKADDPGVLNNPEHLKAQPSADAYLTGDPSTFAEDVHPSAQNWKAEYGADGTTERDEIGKPQMRDDTFNHPEKAPGSSPARGSKSASLSEETVIKKADLCVKVARSMLGSGATDQLVEDQALALMDLPDAALIQTVNRLDGVVQAAQEKQENDDEDDDKKEAAQQQQKQQNDQEDDDKKSNQQQEKKEAGQIPPQFKENIEKKKEEAKDKKDDKKEAAQQKTDDDEKKSNQQQQKQQNDQEQKKEANQQLQAVQQQLQALQQQLQQMQAQQQPEEQMAQQQQVQQNQQQQQPQMAQQQMDDDSQLLDQMLAQQMQQEQPQVYAGDQTEIQIEGAQMDVGETALGPEDDVLTSLFASSPEVMQAQAALALETGVPFQPAAQPRQVQASQGFVRTAATRTVGTHPTGGVSQLGGSTAPAAEAGGGEIDKLSNLWNSAPDVSQVFNPTY